ncbi:MAG: acyl-CoA thioesterase [Planctomycetaceae bacterium]|jgi:acyl-CoA thioester hydrolase|nr:acyl-CoA thioesterase [Planctomycetaceae bacterium]
MHNKHSIEIRVRYQETDQGGLLYHGNYFAYFEMGRTELLRSSGYTYREMEAAGAFAVVVKLDCSYKRPARYDDLLTLNTEIVRSTKFKVEHEYTLYRNEELLAIAHTTIGFVNREGIIVPVPEWMAIE